MNRIILDSEQDGGLQTVVLDRVHGAGRPGAVLVSGAGVIDIFPALAASDGFPAIRTFQKTAEQVNLAPFGGSPGIAYQQGLHLVKGFMGDNRLVGIGDMYCHGHTQKHLHLFDWKTVTKPASLSENSIQKKGV